MIVKLAFLDTQISLSSNNDLSLITSVYRKPTDTKTIINFHAVCPWIWKSGLVKCFLNRAFIVCNNWFAFHEEISKLKDICCMNGYPKDIFYNLIIPPSVCGGYHWMLNIGLSLGRHFSGHRLATLKLTSLLDRFISGYRLTFLGNMAIGRTNVRLLIG